MKMYIVFIIHVAFLVSTVSCYGGQTNVDARLTKIEKQLDILTNEIKKLKEDEDEAKDSGKEEKTSPIVMEEIRGETTEEGVRVTVIYSAMEDTEVKVNWKNFYSPVNGTMTSTLKDLGGGRWESITLFPDHDLHYWQLFLFTTPNEEYRLKIELRDPDGVSTNVQTQFYKEDLKVVPEGDLVYEPGTDLRLTVVVPLSAMETADSDYIHENALSMITQVVDPETNQFVTLSDPPNLFQILNRKRYLSYIVFDVELKTSNYPTSGLISFLCHIRFQNELVRSIDISQSVGLRPSNQSGIFPPDYLAVAVKLYSEYNGNGTRIVYCYEEEICRLDCQIAGQNISDVSVAEILLDGSRRQLIPEESSSNEIGRKTEVLLTSPEARSSHEKHCTCSGSNVKGKTVSEDILVNFLVLIQIIKDRSTMELIDKNSSSSLREINVTCTVRGRPRPVITFTLDTVSGFWTVQPDDVISLGNDEFVAWKKVVFDEDDVYGWATDNKGKLVEANCMADQPPGIDTFLGIDSYVIPMIDFSK